MFRKVMFHLHLLNDLVSQQHCNLVDLLTKRNDGSSHQSLTQPRHDLHHMHVLHALRRLLLDWNDDKLLTNFQPLLGNVLINTGTLDPSTAFLMVTMTSRPTVDNDQNLHSTVYCSLQVDLVYRKLRLESSDQPSFTRVRSFGFMSKNNHIPSYIFPLLVNVLKWWHGKMVFVSAPETDQSSKLKLLYRKYITMYANVQKRHFESYFSLQNINSQLQKMVTNTIQSLRLNSKSKIIFQSFEKRDIKGRDVSSLLVALASLSTATNSSRTVVSRHQYIYYLDIFIIDIICSYLQNNCIYNTVYDFLHKNRHVYWACPDVEDCDSFIPSHIRIKTHYYDDLVMYR